MSYSFQASIEIEKNSEDIFFFAYTAATEKLREKLLEEENVFVYQEQHVEAKSL